jgi:surfeit locus 1 family protein
LLVTTNKLINLGKFEFRAALVPTVATFLLLPILIGLGLWQLDRARYKEALLAEFKAQAGLPYVPLAEVDLASPVSLYRKVIVEGYYDSRHQILLDNQIHHGQPGYHVYTPLRSTGNGTAILVNRGWISLGVSRQHLPDIAVTEAKVSLKGLVAQPANPGLRLQISVSPASWPQVVQYLDYQQLSAELDYSLAPSVILLAAEEENGFWREWQPRFPGSGPERHRGYAVQWFALAVTLMVIYIVVNTKHQQSEHV